MKIQPILNKIMGVRFEEPEESQQLKGDEAKMRLCRTQIYALGAGRNVDTLQGCRECNGQVAMDCPDYEPSNGETQLPVRRGSLATKIERQYSFDAEG